MDNLERIVEEVLEELDDDKIEEAPAAPVAPPKRETVPSKPAPSRPAPTPQRPEKPSPFNPPRPQKLPNPKNYKANVVTEMVAATMEDYDTEAHPSMRNFWGTVRQSDHLFAKHPMYAMHGDQLSKASYKFARDRHGEMPNPQQLGQMFMRIRQLERQNEAQLIELAKKVTEMVWKIPPEMLEADLTDQVDKNQPSTKQPNVDDKTLKDLVDKRITINSVIQGSAVHAMMTVHHLVRDGIEAIDERLMDLYDKMSSGSVGMYWLVDLNQMLAMLSQSAAGSSNVDFDGDQPKVVAKAVIFPVLVQELMKGVAELVSMHGFSGLDGNTLEYVYDIADAVEHEPLLIQTGPEVWRRLLKAKPKDVDLAEFIRDVSMMDPGKLHKAMDATIENPESATKYFQDEPEEPEQPEYDQEPDFEPEDDEDESWDLGHNYQDNLDDEEDDGIKEDDIESIGYDDLDDEEEYEDEDDETYDNTVQGQGFSTRMQRDSGGLWTITMEIGGELVYHAEASEGRGATYEDQLGKLNFDYTLKHKDMWEPDSQVSGAFGMALERLHHEDIRDPTIQDVLELLRADDFMQYNGFEIHAIGLEGRVIAK